MRLPERGSFEDLLQPVRIDVSSLVRLSRHPATEPYWSTGVYRFDDPAPGREGAFGTCYTASSIEVAFAESVIHESGRFALKALGLNNDISASGDYTGSQAWARAIHGASPRWDGIRYVSR
jgi:hypothetical protein